MADIESNIKVGIDTSGALASLKTLQRQISAFQSEMSKSSAANAAHARNLQKTLVDNINATGKFSASVTTVRSATQTFTDSLEKNKFSLGQYFSYAGGASKSFGRLFKTEFDTIGKVARERVKDLQTQYISLGRDANGIMQAIKVRPLMLDMENLATKTAIAAQKQQLLNQLLKQGSTNLLNFGKNTQWAGRQLMVGFTVPLVMMGGLAVKAFMQMEEQVIRFKRVYGDLSTTIGDTNKMAGEVQKLASTFTQYGVAVADTMKMAADAAAMGKTGADLLAQITSASTLAVLGGIDQQAALQTTISLTNAFGITADQLAGKINFLNAVENQTITNIDDLTTAIPKAAPVIKQLGGSVEDLTFFLTAMREGGISAAEGANALKSGLASIINPTAKAKAMLSSFGIDLVGLVNKDKGNVKKTIIDLGNALNQLDPLKRAQAIETMFGKFQFARISTLLKNVTDQNSQANKVLKLAQGGPEMNAILAERELSKVRSSPMYQFKKAMADLQLTLVPLGKEFLKAITPIAKFVEGILKSFNGLGDGTKGFITNLTLIVAGVGPLILMTVGLVSNGIANVIKLFANIKSSINNMGNSSKTLGEQTAYMTQAELEAAAAASSLEQVHSNLVQTFTSEASAVNALTTAYERNIVQQRAFGAGTVFAPITNVAPKTPVKKYNTGTTYVPGPRGAGDIVPALLSPGEAVIPAKNVSKYSGIIGSIVNGTLPHMASGGYVSEAQKAYQAKMAAERAAKNASPEGKARLAATQAAYKKKMPHVYLHDSKFAGPLTEDSPVTQRIIQDQNRGKVIFVTQKDAMSFTSTKEYMMLRKLGLGASSSKWGVVAPWKAKALGETYNVNVYGSKGGIIRRYAQGGIVPGYRGGVSLVPRMIQDIIGPLTLRQTQRREEVALQLEEMSQELSRGPYGNVQPTNFGTQISPSSGHSFPAFGVGGLYEAPNGKKMFVKPQIDLTSAMAEIRATEIARSVHGLEAPKQSIHVILDPTDPMGKRKIFALASEFDEKFASPGTSFTTQQYFRQLVASLLRGDKDLGVGNLGGNVLADVGTAGVFQKASGKRVLGESINSMEQQAVINLLGIKGGAKKFFAESTSGLMSGMTPAQYDQMMKAEIASLIPKLNATIAGFGPLNPQEAAAYADMQRRLQQGLATDWSGFHVMHSAVPPKQYARGIASVPGFARGLISARQRVKPNASVFDIDDTLLDLSSFMEKHKAENEKLPEDQKKKWYKEVAKDPKGIPAGLAALRAAQERGNKIILMTARPDFYEPYTMETLQKLGINMAGIKLLSRRDKDYRKPHQMKYDKTSALMRWYNIQEFYDDMPETRGAISLLNIPTYNPLKLANGVFSVPGPKGAGDVIPAMLSPGEAVIPAQAASRYRGLIQGMIAGNLPGFEQGIDEVDPASRRFKGMTAATMFLSRKLNFVLGGGAPGQKAESSAVVDEISQGGAATFAPLAIGIARKLKLSIKDPAVNAELQAAAKTFSDVAAKALHQSGRKFVDDTDIEELIVPKLKEAASGISISGKSIATAVDELFTEIKSASMVGLPGGTKQSGIESGGRAHTPGSYKSMQKVSQVLAEQWNPDVFFRETKESGSRPGLMRSWFMMRNKKTGEVDNAEMAHLQNPVSMGFGRLKESFGSQIDKVVKTLGTIRVSEAIAKEAAGEIVDSVSIPLVDAVKKKTKTNSPSREADKVGQDIGAGFIQGGQKKVAAATTEGEALGAAVTAGVARTKRRVISSGGVPGQITTNVTDFNAVVPVSQSRKGRRVTSTEGAPGDIVVYTKEDPKTAERQAQAARRAEAASARTQMLLQQDVVANEQQLMQQKSQNVGGMGFGRMSMIAFGIQSMASMAGSIPGKIGESVNSLMPLISGVSMALPLLQSLSTPIALALAAISSVGVAIWSMNDGINKARDAGIKLADSMTNSKNKFIELSKITGTVSAAELADKKRQAQINGMKYTGKASFGETFLTSTVGKSMLADISTMTKSGMNAAQVTQNMAQQLALDVQQGILSTSQAQSIALAIGQALQNRKFGVKLEAQIVDIVGPGGQRLTNNPQAVAEMLMGTGGSNAMSSISSATRQQANPFMAIPNQAISNPLATIGTGIAAKQIYDKISTEGIKSGLQSYKDKIVNSAGKVIFKDVVTKMSEEGTQIVEKIVMRKGLGFLESLATKSAGRWAMAAATADIPYVDIATTLYATISTGIEAIGIWNQWGDIQKKNAKITAAGVELGVKQVQNNQAILDGLKQQYALKIANANTGQEKQKLSNSMYAGIDSLNAQNAKYMDSLVNAANSLGDQWDAAINSSIDVTFKKADASVKAQVSILKETLSNALAGTTDTKEKRFYQYVQVELAAGQLDPSTAQFLIDAAKNNRQLMTDYIINIKKHGSADTSMLFDMLNSISIDKETRNLLVNMSTKYDSKQFQELLIGTQTLNQLSQNGIDIKITSSNYKAALDVAMLAGKLGGLPDQLTKNMVLNMIPMATNAGTKAAWQGVYDQWNKVSNSDGVVDKKIMLQLAMTMQTDPMGLIKDYLSSGGATGEFANMTQDSINNLIATTPVNDLIKKVLGPAAAWYTKTFNTVGSTALEKQQKQLSSAQAMVDYYQAQIDKVNTGLAIIQSKEDKINKIYDARIKALDDVQAANEAISQQQKDQLDLADALSKGDIAAAAKAAQTMRSNDNQRALEDEKKALNASRDAQIKALTDPLGRTRAQDQKIIDNLTNKINLLKFNIIDPLTVAIKKLATISVGQVPTFNPTAGAGSLYSQQTPTTGFSELQTKNSGFSQAIENSFGTGANSISQYTNWFLQNHDQITNPGLYTGFSTAQNPIAGVPTVAEYNQLLTAWNNYGISTAAPTTDSKITGNSPKLLATTLKSIKNFDKFKVITGTNAKGAVPVTQETWNQIEAEKDYELDMSGANVPNKTTLVQGNPIVFGDGKRFTFQGYISNDDRAGDGHTPIGNMSTYMLLKPIKKAGGGHIMGPGTGTSDQIPAMLSNGEYVIRAAAVKALGVNTLDKMNHAEKFANGGRTSGWFSGGGMARYANGGRVSGWFANGGMAGYKDGGFIDTPGYNKGHGKDTTVNDNQFSVDGMKFNIPLQESILRYQAELLEIPKFAKRIKENRVIDMPWRNGLIKDQNARLTDVAVFNTMSGKFPFWKNLRFDAKTEKTMGYPALDYSDLDSKKKNDIDGRIDELHRLQDVAFTLRGYTALGNDDSFLMNAARFGAYLTPVVGASLSALNTEDSLSKGDFRSAALNSLGMLPAIGGVSKIGSKVATGLIEKGYVKSGKLLGTTSGAVSKFADLINIKIPSLLLKPVTKGIPLAYRGLKSAFSKIDIARGLNFGGKNTKFTSMAKATAESASESASTFSVAENENMIRIAEMLEQKRVSLASKKTLALPSRVVDPSLKQSVSGKEYMTKINDLFAKVTGDESADGLPIYRSFEEESLPPKLKEALDYKKSKGEDFRYDQGFGGRPKLYNSEIGNNSMTQWAILKEGYGPIWDEIKKSPELKAVNDEASKYGKNTIGTLNEYVDYLASSWIGLSSKNMSGAGNLGWIPGASYVPETQLRLLGNKLWAKHHLNLDPESGTMQVYRNPHTAISQGVELDTPGYWSFDKHMAHNFHAADDPYGYFSRPRTDVNAKPAQKMTAHPTINEMFTTLGHFEDEFAVTLGPISSRSTKYLGPKTRTPLPSWYTDKNSFFGSKWGEASGFGRHRFGDPAKSFVTYPTNPIAKDALDLKSKIDLAMLKEDINKILRYQPSFLSRGIKESEVFESIISSFKPVGKTGKVGLDIFSDSLMKGGNDDWAYQKFMAIILSIQKQMPENKFIDLRNFSGKYANGGMVKPKYFAEGGYARGTDIVPAMLTPGEFIINKSAVDRIGTDKLQAINSGTSTSDSMYNYNISINAGSNASADDIARTVMIEIKKINNQELRGVTL